MLKLIPIDQEGAYPKEYKEKCRLIELCGMNRMRKMGEFYTEEGISWLTVAAAGKEAAKSAESVRYCNYAGNNGQNLIKLGFVLFKKENVRTIYS